MCSIKLLFYIFYVNSMKHGYTQIYIGKWGGSSCVQVIACRLLGAKPLPAPIANWTLKDKLHGSFNHKTQWFFFRKIDLTMSSAKFKFFWSSVLQESRFFKIYMHATCNASDANIKISVSAPKSSLPLWILKTRLENVKWLLSRYIHASIKPNGVTDPPHP